MWPKEKKKFSHTVEISHTGIVLGFSLAKSKYIIKKRI